MQAGAHGRSTLRPEGWSGGIGMAMPSFTLASQGYWGRTSVSLQGLCGQALSPCAPLWPPPSSVKSLLCPATSHLSVWCVFVELDNKSCHYLVPTIGETYPIPIVDPHHLLSYRSRYLWDSHRDKVTLLGVVDPR